MTNDEIRQRFDQYITLKAQQDELLRSLRHVDRSDHLCDLEWLLLQLRDSKDPVSGETHRALTVLFYQDDIGDEEATTYAEAVDYLWSYISGEGQQMDELMDL